MRSISDITDSIMTTETSDIRGEVAELCAYISMLESRLEKLENPTLQEDGLLGCKVTFNPLIPKGVIVMGTREESKSLLKDRSCE